MGNAKRNHPGACLTIRAACVALFALMAAAACTVKDTTAPPLSGPSESALSIVVTATPDSISQDGASQSSIQVFARDANAKPISGLTLRMSMTVDGQPADYGTLSARTIVTGTDGKATTVFTAPPAQPAGANTPTCAGTIFSPTVPGACVNVVATPISNAFQTVTAAFVTLRLVPVGVILPPSSTPTAQFTMSPTPVTVGGAVLFDATSSCAGQMSGGACSSADTIVSYAWNFGDGVSGTGRTSSHTFTSAAAFSVTLTVTNNRGLAASSTQSVLVGSLALPKPDFVFSPSAPTVNQTVLFNADTSTAATGHTLTTFNWNFGDGATATGFTATHAFTQAGSYTVVLSVLDDIGQKATASKAVQVTTTGGGGGSLTAAFTMSPTDPVSGTPVSFNANTSTPLASITQFDWDFGDGTVINGQTTPSITHSFFTSLDATFTIRLTVHDNTGQIAVTTQTLKVSSGVGPSVLFTITPSPAKAGVAVAFDASGSTGLAPLTYQWDFGDGSPIDGTSGVAATHTYAVAGTYTIRLTVTDRNGRSSATTHTLLVQP